MIKTIKLKNCVPFQQAEIVDCKKVNFIYGANGSGKTTISTFLQRYPDANARFGASSIEWDSPVPETIEVYNRDFRRQNLQQDNMPGIFTLGRDNIKEIEEIKQLRNNMDQKEAELGPLKRNLDECEKEEKPKCEARFKEDVWERILRKNEKDFSKAFEGFRGSKDRFSAEVLRRKECVLGQIITICDREDMLKRSQTLYASKPEKRKTFNVNDIQYLFSKTDQVRNDSIWGSAIVGNTDVDISALIKELNISSWVSQGRQYLRDNSKKCPFCQQETITDEFRRKLESFFDKEYERNRNRLKEHRDNYTHIAEQIIQSLEDVIKDMDDSIDVGRFEVEMFKARKTLLKGKFDENVRIMEEKISEPEKRVSIRDVSSLFNEIINQFDTANELIRNHNKLVDNHALESEKLTEDIWSTCLFQEASLIKKYLEDIGNLEKKARSLKEKIRNKEQDIEHLKEMIVEKEKNITSIQPAIDTINKYLRMYGFTNFSIQPVETGRNYYCIKRDDGTKVEDTLSEGEETFLTFLYFMQKVDGATDQDHISDKRIIVLDDPICSLDSSIMYIVSSMVRALIGRIRDKKNTDECRVTQLFVLTHNVFFHKEASYPLDRNKKNDYVNYWFVTKKNNIASIKAYGNENPISTSYELLWKELKETKEASVVSIQNIMRRIIEYYYMSLGKEEMDNIIKQLGTVEDKMFVRSLFLWMNGGSHAIPDDLYFVADTDSLQHYKELFKLVFQNSGHLAHYNMMMGEQDEPENAAERE